MEIGSKLKNRYIIQESLGEGGMGSVYKALDQSLGVQVAIKENRFTDDNYTRQFKREAVILANLRHPNLPRVTDHFVIEGQGQYLVMDYIEGKNLREIIDRDQKLDEFTVRKIGITIADALNYLHNLNPSVIHRDIKPSNIKINPKGDVYLVDFGLAKQITGGDETTTGARGLTPGYSPPEQYGSARTDGRSDIYSLGATLYVSLTGQPPAEGMNRAMKKAELAPADSLNRAATRDIAIVLDKSLAIHPRDRYQSAEDFKNALMGQTSGTESSATIFEKTRMQKPEELAELVQQAPGDYYDDPTRMSPSKKRSLGVPIVLAGGLGLIVVCAVLIFIGVQLFGGVDDPDGVSVLDDATTTPEEVIRPTEPIGEATATSAEQVTEFETSTPTRVLEPTSTFTPADSPTSAETPQGGNTEIAIVSDRTGLPQIWLISLDGADYIQITNSAEGACQPSWSPDGQRLAYISPCEGNYQQYPGAGIYITNIDGSENYRLMSVPGGDFDPAWSPDGSKMVFTTLRESNRPQIWLYDFETGEANSLSNNFTHDYFPAWAPDSFHIAFVTTRGGTKTEIWVMNINGEIIGEFTRNLDRYHSEPEWSPDGETILYTQSTSSGGIPFLMAASWDNGENTRGFDETRVAPASIAVPMREADYSPDMNWIVYEGYPDGSNHDMFALSLVDFVIVKLTGHQAFEFDPAWRP